MHASPHTCEHAHTDIHIIHTAKKKTIDELGIIEITFKTLCVLNTLLIKRQPTELEKMSNEGLRHITYTYELSNRQTFNLILKRAQVIHRHFSRDR